MSTGKKLMKAFRVKPGKRIRLADIDPRDTSLLDTEVKPKSDEPPSLYTTLGFLLNHKEILDDRHLQKALTGLRDQKSADLNLLVHNLTFHADETKARTLWKDFEKLLRKAFA